MEASLYFLCNHVLLFDLRLPECEGLPEETKERQLFKRLKSGRFSRPKAVLFDHSHCTCSVLAHWTLRKRIISKTIGTTANLPPGTVHHDTCPCLLGDWHAQNGGHERVSAGWRLDQQLCLETETQGGFLLRHEGCEAPVRIIRNYWAQECVLEVQEERMIRVYRMGTFTSGAWVQECVLKVQDECMICVYCMGTYRLGTWVQECVLEVKYKTYAWYVFCVGPCALETWVQDCVVRVQETFALCLETYRTRHAH